MTNIRTPQEIRKHFEASLTSVAKLYNLRPEFMRTEFKKFLQGQNVIIESTKELTPCVMEGMAKIIGDFAFHEGQRPPEMRSDLYFNALLYENKTYSHGHDCPCILEPSQSGNAGA